MRVLIREIVFTAKATKQLRGIPSVIQAKLLRWVELVDEHGLEETRKIPGFHDEPLKGVRLGQRSIRLNKAYRAIYVMGRNGAIEFISVEEVSKHGY